MKKLFVSLIAAFTAAFASVSAIAQTAATGPDFTSLTNSLSPGTTVTAIMAVAAFLVLIFLAVRGAKIVLSMIRGG